MEWRATDPLIEEVQSRGPYRQYQDLPEEARWKKIFFGKISRLRQFGLRNIQGKSEWEKEKLSHAVFWMVNNGILELRMEWEFKHSFVV